MAKVDVIAEYESLEQVTQIPFALEIFHSESVDLQAVKNCLRASPESTYRQETTVGV